jgi:hypothetical protein
MPLNKAQLEAKFIQILSDPKTESNVATVSAALADAVDEYVKGALIVYTSGLVAPSGGGPVTGTFVGNLE